jgi:hypothetical protein
MTAAGLAVPLAVLGLLIEASAFRFNRFTTLTARRVLAARSAADYPLAVPIHQVQNVMTPPWTGMVLISGCILVLVSAFLGFSVYGWAWPALLGALVFLAPIVL